MSTVLPHASRSVSRGGTSIPVRGAIKPNPAEELLTALTYLFSLGIVFYNLEQGYGWNSGYLIFHW
jgi:hypothetical protein